MGVLDFWLGESEQGGGGKGGREGRVWIRALLGEGRGGEVVSSFGKKGGGKEMGMMESLTVEGGKICWLPKQYNCIFGTFFFIKKNCPNNMTTFLVFFFKKREKILPKKYDCIFWAFLRKKKRRGNKY